MTTKSTRVIRQIVVGAASHDAITSIAVSLGHELENSFDTRIYSWFEPDISVRDQVQQIAYCDSGSANEIVIYHLSFGIPELTKWLIQRPEKFILWYHNVTPAEFYSEIDPVFAKEHGG